jgi:hypothetical protein
MEAFILLSAAKYREAFILLSVAKYREAFILLSEAKSEPGCTPVSRTDDGPQLMRVRGEIIYFKLLKTGMFLPSLHGCIHGEFEIDNLTSYP